MIDYIFVIGSAVLGLATAIAILTMRPGDPSAAPGVDPSANSQRPGFFAAVRRTAVRALEYLGGSEPA